MQKVLGFIKTHLISLLCAVFAIGAIVFAGIGISSEEVTAAMTEQIQQTGASTIANLKRTAKNQEIIDAKKREGELFDEQYGKTVEAAKTINKREPLMDGVFPLPARDTTRFKFKEAYVEALRRLPVTLQAGTLPTEADIAEEVQNVDDLYALEQEQEDEGAVDKDKKSTLGRRTRNIRPSRPRPGQRRRSPVYGEEGGRGEGGRGEGGRGEGGGPRGMGRQQMYNPTAYTATVNRPPADEPKYDPVYRARVSKAKSIRCYVQDGTFHISPIAQITDAPTPQQMWFAQVGLWIQGDIVNAVSAMNDEAAVAVKDGDPSVAQMPVKRLIAVRLSQYVLPPSEDDQVQTETVSPVFRLGSGQAMTLGAPAGGSARFRSGGQTSFTGRSSNEQYDVVQFSVQVVMDQRRIPGLIDRISRENFYQCTSVNYEAIDREQHELGEGYFYGTTPVVLVTAQFEGYMLREVYEPLMPPAIRKMLGIEKEEE